jgi:hypothetical protein
MHPFQSERLLASSSLDPLNEEQMRNFEHSEEGKKFRLVQSSENEAALAHHDAFKAKYGHTWSEDVTAAHDRIARQLKRGIIGAPDALQQFIRLHGDNHPLQRGQGHLGPQFKG